jgi:hypothetical protein
MTEPMRAFFKYFGAKHRAVARYPVPEHEVVIEPFAGSAAYATRYAADRKAVLVDKDPIIVAVWRYLIAVRPREVLRLPDLEPGQKVSDIPRLTDEQRYLIGFWLRTGSPDPRDTPSSWAKTPEYADRFWGQHVRERIARQVTRIREWKVQEGSYEQLDNPEATWFIDPPYQIAGSAYRFGSGGIDYDRLAGWVRDRRGMAIVCEAHGATWLDFEHLGYVRSNVNVKGDGTRFSGEVVYVGRSPVLQPRRRARSPRTITTTKSDVMAEFIAAREALATARSKYIVALAALEDRDLAVVAP